MHRLSVVVGCEAINRSFVVRNLFEEIKRPVMTFDDEDQLIVLSVPVSSLRSTQQQVCGSAGSWTTTTNTFDKYLSVNPDYTPPIIQDVNT